MAQDPPSGSSAIDFNPLIPPQLDDPYPAYARARREAPVFFSPIFGLWIVTRHDDVCAAAQDTARFSSRVIGIDVPAEVSAVLPAAYHTPSLVNNDPPSHTRLRGLLGRSFAPQRIAHMEPHVRSVAAGLIDAFARDGRVDLMEGFAYELPLRIILEMLGVPLEDGRDMKRWSDDWRTLSTPGLTTDKQLACVESVKAFERYILAAAEHRRREPRDDLLSHVIVAGPGGEPPAGDAELVNLFMQLLFAGHETVTTAIGNAVLLLLGHPEQLAAVREDPGLIPAVVEESLRFEAPTQGMFRTTTEEVELGGVRIPQGARVFLLFGSANRDEGQFEAADTFDVQRRDAGRHLAFGRGLHFCIGASLARLEVRIALEELLGRLPGLRLQPGERQDYVSNLILRNPKHVRVVWDLA
jgi:cytochrome P450